MASDDGEVAVDVVAEEADRLPDASVFGSIGEASEFFRQGSLGYPLSADGDFDGIELFPVDWEITPLSVEAATYSYFEGDRFPDDAVRFDVALLMRDIAHAWHRRESVCV